MPTQSGFYKNTVIGALRAAGQIEHWDNGKINPSGFRHHESGQYRPDAKQVIALIGGFTAQRESGIALDFGGINVPDNSGFVTNTVIITFNLGEVNSNKNSFFDKMVDEKTVGQDFKAFNMRLWMGSLSAFSGMPTPSFYFRNSAQWLRGYDVIPGDSGVFLVPSSLPSPNIFSKSPTSVFVSGNFTEKEFSHFLYIKGVFGSGNYSLGTYGGLGEKNFVIRFSYDWTIKNSSVLETDL